MSSSQSNSGAVVELAEEFIERHRRGERPSLKEYIDRYPELAAEIKDVFPAMAMMENIAVADESLERGAEAGPERPADRPFEQLGDYRIIREIGHGGMGIVYEAEQVSLGRHVALKVLPNQALKDAKQKRRFEREARAAAKLHHTNIVPVFGVGEHGGLPYYVMQYIQGLGLDAVLDELNHIKPGGSTAGSVDEIRVIPRGATAAQMARSLMTGAFPHASESIAPEPTAAETVGLDAKPVEEETGRLDGENAAPATSPEPADTPRSGQYPDSLNLSGSSLSLPGASSPTTGRKAAARKPTYWHSVAIIGRQVADALDYAHRQGVLHRDVKPSNLLLDLRGTVWVTDFGLAKVAGPGADNLTHTGDVLGTLRYMPAEAFEGKSDARSDVYSLGLTLYELLARRPAFDEKERNRLIKQVMNAEPTPLDRVNREIPRDLVTIVQKSIEKEPARRYATAEEMAADLQRYIDDEPILARRQTEWERCVRWARHNPGIAALGVVLASVLALATIASVIVAGRMARTAATEQGARRQAEQAKRTAESSDQEAREAERLARAAEEEGRKLLYTTDMQLAPFVWRDDRTTADQLRVLLARHIPEERMKDEGGRMNETGRKPVSSFVLLPSSVQKKPDLRGFEWYYYKQLLDGSSTVLRAGAAAIIDFALPHDGPLVTLDQEGRLKQWDRETTSLDSGLPSPNADAAKKDLVVDLSPNGKRLASAAGKTVRLWDTATGVASYQLESSGALRDLSFSPDGRYLVTHDGRRTQWLDAANGQAIAHFDQAIVEFDLRSPRLSISADGLTVAVWAQGNTQNRISIFRLDATARKVAPQAEGLGNGDSMASAALSPDGNLIAVGGSFTGSLFVYETATRRLIASHRSAHASPVSAIAFSQDGLDLATADAEGMIKTWGDARKLTSESESHRTLKGHAAAITKVSFSNTGKQLVSGSRDGTVRLWELEPSRSGPRRLQASSAAPVFFAGGRLIATAEGDRVTIWDAASSQRLRSLAEGDRILSLAVSPDNRLLAVGRSAETDPARPYRPCYLSIWEMNTGRRLAEFFDQDLDHFFAYCALETLAFSPDGEFLVAGLGSRGSHYTSRWIDVKVWEVATLRESRRLVGHANACVSISFSPDGTRMATGSHDGTARIWDTATWRVVGEPLRAPGAEVVHRADPSIVGDPVEAVAFSPDGRTLAMATMSGSILLWNTRSRERATLPRAHANSVVSIAFSPDGRTLASGGQDNAIRLWNVATGRELMVLNSRDLRLGSANSLSFSPDGTQLLANCSQAGVVVWSAAPCVWDDPTLAGKELRPLLAAPADFQRHIRMWSDIPRLPEALETLDARDRQVQAALAATRASRHARRRRWADAVKECDRLQELDPDEPQAWLRTPGLIRVATALLHEGRPAQAAILLQGGAERRAQDGLPLVVNAVMLGFLSSTVDGQVRITELLPGSPAARSTLARGDVIAKINDIELTEQSLSRWSDLFRGGAGTKFRLTVRHAGSEKSEVIELTKERFVSDPATGDELHPLRAVVKERLAREPSDAGLLELRAELAGQWSDVKAQVADYTAAIAALSRQEPAASAADLRRLYGRRGIAYLKLEQWQEAVDDLAHVVTEKTTDIDLLSKQARAHEALKNWDAAAADWSRVAIGNPDGAKWLAEFARRLAAADRRPLAKAQFEKSEALYDRSLRVDPENGQLAAELAQLLLDKEAHEKPMRWTVLKPSEMKSRGGATLTLLKDGSILSGGKHPERDDYVIKATADIKDITAIAVDVLPHDSLGGRVGREENGNFLITELEVFTQDDSSNQKPVAMKEAVADFETQHGTWPASKVIDGKNDQLGWGVDPLVEAPHRLVVQPRQPIAAGTTALTFIIRQNYLDSAYYKPGPLLGRFRLSVSGDPAAFEGEWARFAARKLMDPWVNLALAYAVNGRNDEALDYLSRALQRAEGPEARKPILEIAAHFDEVFSALVKWRPDDPQWQLALARILAAHGKQRLAEKRPAQAQAELEEARQIFAWLTTRGDNWTVAVPVEMKTESGARLEVQTDGSVFAHQVQPCRFDTYSLVFTSELKGIKGLRLEALADSRLPEGGPGWAINGNFALAELTLLAASSQGRDEARSIALRNPSADYNQTDWDVRSAIDDDDGTGWAVHPEFGEDHVAVFDLAEDVGDGQALRLTVRLKQGDSGIDRVFLGRFRVSFTSDAETLQATRVRLDLKAGELVDLYVALGKAYARQGETTQAVASFAEALPLVVDRNDAARIITEAGAFDGVLEKLSERAAGDGRVSAANPRDPRLSQMVAALQAWFGQEPELAATRRRVLAFAKGTNDADTAGRAALVCSLVPSTDQAELDAALDLARAAVKLGHGGDWSVLALGMAEYRLGHDVAAEKALSEVAKAGPNNDPVVVLSSFFRAMSSFRLGKKSEARKRATEAVAGMRPLPADENNPLAEGAGDSDLIMWLAYKEAKAMLHFDAAPGAPKTPERK